MSNVACTCIIQFCRFYKKLEFAEPRFLIEHLLRHDEQDLKEIAVRLGVVGYDTKLTKEAIARRLLSFCRLRQ